MSHNEDMSNYTESDNQLTAFFLSRLQEYAERRETPSSTFGEQALAAFTDVVDHNVVLNGRSEILALAEALAQLANPSARLVFDRD